MAAVDLDSVFLDEESPPDAEVLDDEASEDVLLSDDEPFSPEDADDDSAAAVDLLASRLSLR